jgi:hypothetical protein
MNSLSLQNQKPNPRSIARLWPILLVFLSLSSRAEVSLKPSEFVNRIQQSLKTEDLYQAARNKTTYQENIPTVFKNPQIQFGRGILEYNAGQGLADYQEFSVVQGLTVDGSPRKKKQMARIEGIKSSAKLQQENLFFISQALLLAAEATFTAKKLAHVKHRQEHLSLITNYLKSRKFNSPKKQLESQLLKVKLDEIEIENQMVISKSSSLQSQLQFLLGTNEAVVLYFKAPNENKVRSLVEKLKPKKTLPQKMAQSDLKLAHLEKSIVDHQWIPELQFYYIHSEEEFFGGNKVDVFGLGLEIPIFDMGRNRRALASANLRTMELKTKQTQLINYTQKQRLIQDVSLALKALGVYTEQKIEARERAFERASRHFKKGQIDAQSFLDFEHEAHAGRAQRFQHQLALLKGLVELTALSGEETLLLDIFQ